MKEVTLHQHEQARLHAFNSVIAGQLEIGEAAALMDQHTLRGSLPEPASGRENGAPVRLLDVADRGPEVRVAVRVEAGPCRGGDRCNTAAEPPQGLTFA